MRQNEQEESANLRGPQFNRTFSESPQKMAKRLHGSAFKPSNLEFVVSNLPPKRPYRRRADLSKLEILMPHLPPKRPLRHRLVIDFNIAENNGEAWSHGESPGMWG